MKTDRGDFHRRTRRGTALPSVQGAGQKFPCCFCGKTRFRSLDAVRNHERDAHSGLPFDYREPETETPSNPALPSSLGAQR